MIPPGKRQILALVALIWIFLYVWNVMDAGAFAIGNGAVSSASFRVFIICVTGTLTALGLSRWTEQVDPLSRAILRSLAMTMIVSMFALVGLGCVTALWDSLASYQNGGSVAGVFLQKNRHVEHPQKYGLLVAALLASAFNSAGVNALRNLSVEIRFLRRRSSAKLAISALSVAVLPLLWFMGTSFFVLFIIVAGKLQLDFLEPLTPKPEIWIARLVLILSATCAGLTWGFYLPIKAIFLTRLFWRNASRG